MFHSRVLLHFILLCLVFATPQINLHYTDWITDSNHELPHDCLRIPASLDETKITRELITLCMHDLPSKFHIQNNPIFPKFTFAELSKQNITSNDLLLWSASISLAEDYQFYLNQMLASNYTSLGTEIFYNCTFPRFGFECQYELLYYQNSNSSLYSIMNDYYRAYAYDQMNLTCYVHLQCNRGLFPVCLDWTDICNGIVDCVDDSADEENCWELEVNECNDNEYQCRNGLCIPQSFFRDDSDSWDCLDGSDERIVKVELSYTPKRPPAFDNEEKKCMTSPLTSSCLSYRERLILNKIYATRDGSIAEKCFLSFKCMMILSVDESTFCSEFCSPFTCQEIILSECPDMFFIPNVPLVSNEFYIAHTKNDSFIFSGRNVAIPYICYNGSRYNDYFIHERIVLFKNRTCFRPNWQLDHLLLHYSNAYLYFAHLSPLLIELTRYNVIMNYTSAICNRTNMYQCVNSSKCISINRLLNGDFDCPQKDDEDINQISSHDLPKVIKTHFKCELSKKYIHQSNFQDGVCDCSLNSFSLCEDEDIRLHYDKTNILFQSMCNGISQLIPITIQGKNETDETECQNWPCNNIYTRCNHIWNCPKGEDEIGCHLSSKFNCPPDHHICVSPDTNQLMCLPIEKANDGQIDCLGATDEPVLCDRIRDNMIHKGFYCKQNNHSSCLSYLYLCDTTQECDHGEDEQFCDKNKTSLTQSICKPIYASSRSNVERFLCDEIKFKFIDQAKYFTLDGITKAVDSQMGIVSRTVYSTSNFKNILNKRERYKCHHGFYLGVRINNGNNLTSTCLCPASYYGSQCQYQNQRVSLTVQFQALADSWSTLFAIMISLIDDNQERNVHSFEQLSYLSVRDCKIKFNVYLLYSTRSKDSKRNYSIHIDIYEKSSLAHRGSLLFPIKFLFLPVQRLAFIVVIPRKNANTPVCSNSPCVHGKCIVYSNSPSVTSFCQCKRGWSGRFCSIPHACSCAPDSICIGVSAYNRSVCVCPIHKFGPRCLLSNSVCQVNNILTCLHGGQCISTDEYSVSTIKFRCICPRGYIGDRCEIVDNKIILSFNNDIVLFQSIFIHFIEVLNNDRPKRTTTFRTMPLTQNSLTMYWSKPFHLIFIELYKKTYYLALVQNNYTRSTTINTMISQSDRCKHINEIFNETFRKMHIIRRIKYYHLPCQSYTLNLSCFYDDVQLCLCYDDRRQRLANCFDFNHNVTFNCLGQSVCENGGECFQDSEDCPERSTCICQPCFYGTRCQFSSSGFGLSLDAIIGYHIQPNIGLKDQPNIVKITLALTIIFMIAGLANGIVSLIAFNSKAVCEVGCGIYLLSSSITSLLTITVFGLKCFILICAQMKLISNQSFLHIQCSSLDFILRIGLSMDQWLSACVAIERTLVIIKSTSFNRKRSRHIAEIVILILLIFIIASNIYDPIYRRLIDEQNEDETRLWCIALYPPVLQTVNSIFNAVHFSAPFLINFISSIILITKISHQQAKLHKNRTYPHILMEQIKEQKHLLISPVILVILGIPRLVITLVSKCMKSTNDAWLFLAGYFISFISPMLTFIIFVLPSEFYKRELRLSLIKFRARILRH